MDLGFRAEGLEFISGCVRGWDLGSCPTSSRSLPTPGLGFRISDSGFRVSGFGVQVSGFRFQVSGFGFQVSGFAATCGVCLLCERSGGP